MEAVSNETRMSKAISIGKSTILILAKQHYQTILFEEYQDLGREITKVCNQKRKAWNNYLKKTQLAQGSIDVLYYKPQSYAMLLVKGVHEAAGLEKKADKKNIEEQKDSKQKNSLNINGINESTNPLLASGLTGQLRKSMNNNLGDSNLKNDSQDKILTEVNVLELKTQNVKRKIHSIACKISSGKI